MRRLSAAWSTAPPGIPISEADIQSYLDKRRPGRSRFTTQRREPDEIRIFSGVFEDETTGALVTIGTMNCAPATKGMSLGAPSALDALSDAFRGVRMTHAALNYWDASWALHEDQCPCDVHFVEWLDENGVKDAAIFHFGTGEHHYVGVECSRPDRRNAVVGITAAPMEHEKFVELAIQRPDVLRFYNAVFGDIYLLNPKLLPTFDVVTLFHLCEFRGEKNDAYDALTDLEVANLLTDKTRPGGQILFYTRSFAFSRDGAVSAREVIACWERGREVELVGEFKSLLVYRKREGMA